MRIIWHVLFWSCIIAGLAAGIAHFLGRPDLAAILAASFTTLVGLVFLHGCYMSATTVGEAWIIGFGWITRRSNPLVYWAALSMPTFVGAAIFLIGIYWLIQVVKA